jgi:hypothetical protein
MYKLKRLMAIGGASTFLALGGLTGRGATPALADYPSETLFFLCEYSGNDGTAPNGGVYVEGYNQYGTYVSHYFRVYYTWDGSYWWWDIGTYVHFTAYEDHPDGSITTYGVEEFYVSGRATYDTVLTKTC